MGFKNAFPILKRVEIANEVIKIAILWHSNTNKFDYFLNTREASFTNILTMLVNIIPPLTLTLIN